MGKVHPDDSKKAGEPAVVVDGSGGSVGADLLAHVDQLSHSVGFSTAVYLIFKVSHRLASNL